VKTPMAVSFEKAVANVSEKAWRQHAVIEAPRCCAWHRLKVRARPDEIIRLCHHDPRRQIVEAKVTLQGGGYFHRVGGIDWTRVRDRNHRDHLFALNNALHGDNDTGPILISLLNAAEVLSRPKIGIANYQTRTRRR
jgi:hypothetical protein